MKILITLSFLYTFSSVAFATDTKCNQVNQKPEFYKECPLKLLVTAKDTFTVEGERINEGNKLTIKYFFTVTTESKFKGAWLVSNKESIKLNNINIELLQRNCVFNECKLSDYIHSLELNSFEKSVANNIDRQVLIKKVDEKLVELGAELTPTDVQTSLDVFLKESNKPVFFKFLNSQGDFTAYFKSNIDSDGKMYPSEFIYKVYSQGENTWLGNRNYDLEASHAMWTFLGEKNLRRVKECSNLNVSVLRSNKELQTFPATQCSYF
ncbi:hypothetical protein [Pseudoalteromonas gelatinilytica]|uniref:Uncharacterized protein n=1 Tax=Pseudoalteromonas gelatinilytica TaxID=1703256 RepID=A0ABQ1TBE0_9GAMM|nr:hypothetical protein [Pseudoalteromonas profundi]GGE86853.1 hypothetical protein GCM10008027_09760 [Pseudoalteromonas profundi]